MNVAFADIDLKNPASNEGNPGYTKEERDAFTNLLSKGFVDTYRALYPDKVEYTWWSYKTRARERNAGWRIDYFLVSEQDKDLIIDSKIHTDIYGSDHWPIELDIDL